MWILFNFGTHVNVQMYACQHILLVHINNYRLRLWHTAVGGNWRSRVSECVVHWSQWTRHAYINKFGQSRVCETNIYISAAVAADAVRRVVPKTDSQARLVGATHTRRMRNFCKCGRNNSSSIAVLACVTMKSNLLIKMRQLPSQCLVKDIAYPPRGTVRRDIHEILSL